jgi:secreted trypsin-like serine protease
MESPANQSSPRGTSFAAAVLLALGLATSAFAQDTNTATFPIGYVPGDKIAADALPPPAPDRILGGDVAPDGAWPWQVGLINPEQPDLFHGQFCGGSIIASVWVLTAAHCVYDEGNNGALTPVPPARIRVLAGTNYLEDGQGELIDVVAIYAHADYDPIAIDNDIALIRLAHAPTAAVAAVKLPTLAAEQRYAGAGTHAIVTGWGRLQDGRYPIDLRQVEIQLFDRADCNQGAGGGPPKPGVIVRGPITDNMICSGVVEGGKGSCSGDSGGPLMVTLADGTFMQVGVVSWGYTADNDAGCSLEASFSAYTRVARYQDWIRDTVAAAN